MAPQYSPEPMHIEQENTNDEIEDTKKEIAVETLPFYKLLSYADALDWTLMILGTLGSMVHGLAQPVGYLLLGKALNAFGRNINNPDAMVTALYKVIPFVWYMAIATLPAGILEIGCWMYASERQAARMRLAFLRAVLSQEVGAFDTDLTTGKIISGVSNHMNVIQDAIGEKLGHFLSCFATFFSGVLIAFISCWEVSLLTLFVVPLILVIGATYTKKMNAISASKMVYLSQATAMVEQTISQIKTVFAFVGETSAIKSFSECMERQLTISRGEALIKGVGIGMFQTVTFCSWSLIVWVGAIVVAAKRASGGDVIAAVMSILFGAISLTYATPDVQIFNQATAAGKEVFQVIERKPLLSYDTKGKVLEVVDGDIDIRGVHFAYPSRPEQSILRGFSLSIPAGKVVALVGSSGCGKSTIISLVARFYDPEKGEIFVDNHNIKDLELKFLRKNIGAVSQEPSLFAGTIRDNMKVGNIDADDQQIQSAAVMANAHTFISQLPNQYLTEVGERGVQLSGGQKQRIAIARAILKNPPILLLDEATSALDSESEKVVQNALETAMQGRTVILIAHRLSTVVNADMIVVVEDGQVTETGTHRGLLNTSKFYINLFSMQNISVESESRVADPTDETTTAQHHASNKHLDQHEEGTELNRHLTEDHPKQEEQKERRQEHTFFRIWFGLEKKELVKTAIGSIAAALSGISKPVFGFFIITIGVAYYKKDSKQRVGWYSLAFSSIGLISLFSHALQHYFFGVVGEKAMTNLRRALYSAVLHNELAWFEKPENNVGSLTSRILNETSTVKTIISDRMSVIVQCISSILIATTVSMVVNWRMGLVAWAVMPCHFIGGLIQARSAKGFSGDSAAAHSELVALASESATNIKTIASFCHEECIIDKARLSLQGPLRKSRKESIKYGIIQGISLCLWNIAHAVALWYTTVLVKKRQAKFEDGIRAYQIFSLTVPSITELWTLIPTVISAISVLTPAFQTLDRHTEIEPDAPENPPSVEISGEIEFKNVLFSYPLRPQVTILDNFSLHIEAGSKVALVGPSGAGKSSVLALLLRFYDPREGNVLIDRKDIREYNLRKLRSQIGLVQQEPLLFSCSMRENICYGNDGASETEIVEASRQANIHEFISNLPNGYDTTVGEKGCQLSGGQKQRIAIARTLLKRPAIMLLDEATSALDAESERAVVSALESTKLNSGGGLLSRTTRVTVAHRLSTVMNSDTIIVMDKGKVVEMGTHSTLIAASEGVYSRFFRLQKPAHIEEEKTNDEVEDTKKEIAAETLPFHKLLSYADALDWTLMILGTLGSIVHGFAQPVTYLLLGKALDAFGRNINDSDAMVTALNKVIPFVWYMAIATLPAGILEIGCWIYASERQAARMRLAFLRAVLSQEVGAFDTDLSSGKIISGVSIHMSVIQDAIGEKLGHFLSSLATFFSGVLIAFISCWEVSLLTLFVVPLILITGATYAKKMNTISAAKMFYLSEATAMVEQTVSQIKTVFAFVGETSAIKSFSECMGRQLLISRGEALIKGVGTGTFQTVTFCSWSLIVWVGAIVVAAKRANGGDVIAAVLSILFGAISLTYATPDLQIFNQAKAAGKEVFQVIERKPLVSYETRGKVLEAVEGNIELREVHFAYPSRQEKLILKGFSLSIPAGKVVALVGSSGCGKSTIISLVSRFYDPTKGTIFIDNHDIKDLDLKFLRRNIGAVSQEPSLFAGTIRDNMKVGERGVQLSGGQKQRIAIARAILKNPPILLLDEATSALDSESEKVVQDALETAMRGRTVILIAHRMSTIVNADTIIVVENGEVTERGTHRDLLNTSKFYTNLFSMQNLSLESDSSLIGLNEILYRIANPAEETASSQQSKDLEEPEEPKKLNRHLTEDPPKQEERTDRRKKHTFFRIWFGLKKKELVKTIMGSLAAALSGISKPIFGFFVITIGVAYYKKDAKQRVGWYSIAFSSIGLMSLFSNTLQHYLFGVVGEKAMTNLRRALYSAVLHNELAWFEKPQNSVGLLTSRIINETSTVKTIISDRMSVIVQCISSILVATTLSMVVNWRMGLVSWAVMPCHFIAGLIQARSAKGFLGDSAAAHSELVALASESATNIKTIASFCHEEHILEKARLSLQKPLRKSRKESVKYGIIQGIALCLWNIAHAVALWYTTVLVKKKQASFENGVRAYQIFAQTIPSITELWTLIPAVISAISVLTPAFQTLDRQTEMEPDAPENPPSERIIGEIEFQNVHFNYPLRPEVTVLDNLSLHIDAGSKVAIVGPSGAGKSSVLALLLRFYDPREGNILIDRKDIRTYNLRKLRSQIGFVQQEPLLFNFSIRDNICYGNDGASETEIVEASRQANIHEFISNLPDGYDTSVGERGCQLSGGQKQRIAIARTLLKRPAIVLLDEATSALDAESERAVVSALESTKLNGSGGLLSRTTRVTVAHRLSTVINSDAMIVMDKGKVVEMGTHSTLIAASEGVYSRFFRLQSMTEK
ncbi:hypothetical protein RJ640_028351 [Escallonia rubra]|uniref:Uncharacterized protein n=1 Tax=Escallonia rubra TaxID=112253 RepID=A0AA88U6G8_9ASTE|nr:hypothetical protein RJ640_028351 [Escallonia rubra]